MYSKTMIIGNLGKDPEMQYLPSGDAVTRVSVATNRTYTNKEGEKVTETTWFVVSVWGGQAEPCNQYLKKGSKVFIEGYLTPDESGNPRIWTRSDNTPAASYEMKARRVIFLDSREQQGTKTPSF